MKIAIFAYSHGGCLGGEYLRSLLYHPDFTTEYRKGKA